MHSHILIVGGTGMLKEAAIALASSAPVISSVARSKRSLDSLHSDLEEFKGAHYQLQLDWNQQKDFLNSLSAHIQRVGIPSLVVAWLHDDSLGFEIARLCGSATGLCRLFQVRGSSEVVGQAELRRFAEQFAGLPGVKVHQVILGFMRTPRGSRWLDHAEISAGVLEAVRGEEPIAIVGAIEPWSEAP